MPALSTYLRNALRDWTRSTAFPSDPSTLYLALFTSATGPGSEGTEVSGNNYSRISITIPGNLSTDGDGRWVNGTELQSAIASGSWGTVTHVALYDASSDGNRVAYAALASPRAVGSGQRLSFAAGALVLDASGV